MRLNWKDIASGALLVLVAAAGLYLNQDHNLGSARRMGPGYMPMLVFWLQMGLGLLIVALALYNGPDPLERWTGLDWGALALAIAVGTVVALFVAPAIAGAMAEPPAEGGAPARATFFDTPVNAVGLGALAGFVTLSLSPGWRLIAWVLAGMCLFGLLLERGGLLLSIAATVVVAAVADRTHRPLGVLGVTVFLMALCWWVFIRQLDIRVSVFPQF